MQLNEIYESLTTKSPYVEVIIRNLYWRNVKLLKKFRHDGTRTKEYGENIQPCDFSKIIDYLKEQGVNRHKIAIVHSSYDNLKGTGLSPDAIVNKLLDMERETNGTLAMPVIRHFKEEPKYEDSLWADLSDLVCTYEVQKTPVITGFIPYFLMRSKESTTSRFPLNPLCANGPLAAEMMEHNLDGELPSPHGPNSSWKYCMDNDSVIVGLGIDISHHLTLSHVFEENGEWPVPAEKWFRKRRFIIKDKGEIIEKEVYEWKPKWGRLYSAEKTRTKDLKQSGIYIEKVIDGVVVSIVDSKRLCEVMKEQRKKHKTYPYFCCRY